MDSADPFHGWNLAEVLKTSSGLAKNDIYGKLFYYLRDLFSRFYCRLSSLSMSFQLLNIDAQDLSDFLNHRTFARVEVDNPRSKLIELLINNPYMPGF
jgi:hypothetical protein